MIANYVYCLYLCTLLQLLVSPKFPDAIFECQCRQMLTTLVSNASAGLCARRGKIDGLILGTMQNYCSSDVIWVKIGDQTILIHHGVSIGMRRQ